jgi:hypothetical protein
MEMSTPNIVNTATTTSPYGNLSNVPSDDGYATLALQPNDVYNVGQLNI